MPLALDTRSKIMPTSTAETIRRFARIVRVLVMINFGVLLLLLGPGRSHRLDLLLRREGLENLIGRSFQVWTVSSTFIATALFAFMLRKKMRLAASEGSPRIRLEGFLLLGWWLTVAGFLAYGFMLGMGG